MHKMTVAALSGLLILAACGGGSDNQPTTDARDLVTEIGRTDLMPSSDVLSHRFDHDGIRYSGYLTLDTNEWSHAVGEVIGVPDKAQFGVATRGTDLEPWVYGRNSHLDVSENQQLSGTVTWSGGLLGFDREQLVFVGADVALQLDISSLTGDLEFTNMTYWTNPLTAVPGTGAQWRDGDLSYDIAVTGNGFTRTGGDQGSIDGAILGVGHEAMAGTIERPDLEGAFGGSR